MQANGGVLTARATGDIKSHSESTDRVSRLEGKLDQALRSGRERPSRQIVTPHGGPVIRDPDPEPTG